MRRVILVPSLVMLAATASAQADAPPSPLPTEYLVKAAFLYNFARSVRWPFEVNSSAAEQAGLKVSSQLVKLATVVGGSGD